MDANVISDENRALNQEYEISMENSLRTPKFTRDFFRSGFSFSQYRRRPLRSRTCHALIELLSHFRGRLRNQEGDDTDAVLQWASKEKGSMVLNGPTLKDSIENLAQQAYMGEKEGTKDLQKVSSKGIEAISRRNLLEGKREADPLNGTNEMEITVVKSQTGDSVSEIVKKKESVNAILDIQMDEFGSCEELPVDDDRFILGFSEVLDSFMSTDMVVESLKEGAKATGSHSVTEKIPDEVEHELQLKALELEKLIKNSCVLESSNHLKADKEIEEGEISGNAWDANESINSLPENLSLVEERAGYMVQASENSYHKGKSSDQDLECNKYDILDNQNNVGTESENVESGTSIGQKFDFRSLNPLSKSFTMVPRSEESAPSGNIFLDHANENQNSNTTTKEDDARKKKRKRGPLTKEKRDQKKKKERMKRAEKNREHGIKRLKLPPVLKPNTKKYCRHYLVGRCHEGENCNFSHDIVPTTKSKPCVHFARNSCMRGDDCLYDHQLSKYPCKNYASSGFCNRGSNCLFSHETSSAPAPIVPGPEFSSVLHMVPEKGGSFSISRVIKADLKLPSASSHLSSTNKVQAALGQRNDAQFLSAGNSGSSISGLTATKIPLSTPSKTFKGVSFLDSSSGVHIFRGGACQPKQDEPSVKLSDGSSSGLKSTTIAPSTVNKLNEMPEKIASRIPRGVNFLSFTKPSDELNSKILSSINSNVNQGKGDAQVGHTIASCNIVKLNRQNQLVSNSITEPVKSLIVPENASFLESERTSLDSDGGSTHSPCVEVKQTVNNSLKSSLLLCTPSRLQRAVTSTLAFAAKLESCSSSHHQLTR